MGPAQTKQRKSLRLSAALVLAFLSVSSGCGTAGNHAGQNAADSVAPPVSFQTLDGRAVRLADYRGKVVLLNFWGTWCGACRAEIPELIDLQQRYQAKGFTVLGVAMRDQQSAVASFVSQRQFDLGGRTLAMNYPVVMGNLSLEGTFGGFFGYPDTFIISRDGKIVAKGMGVIDEQSTSEVIKKLL